MIPARPLLSITASSDEVGTVTGSQLAALVQSPVVVFQLTVAAAEWFRSTAAQSTTALGKNRISIKILLKASPASPTGMRSEVTTLSEAASDGTTRR